MDDARRATVADRAVVVDTLVRAFPADPMVRWFFPDDLTYRARAAAFFGYLFDIRVEHGEAWLAEGGGGVSLWTPPGGLTMTEADQDRLWTDTVEPGAGPGEMDRLDTFDAALAAVKPSAPHWYLGVLATDPEQRGRGLARVVTRLVLDRADRDGTPAFLETATPTNIALYARFGFEELAHVDLPDGPTVRALWRPPRP